MKIDQLQKINFNNEGVSTVIIKEPYNNILHGTCIQLYMKIGFLKN